jgi:hypothetical protein
MARIMPGNDIMQGFERGRRKLAREKLMDVENDRALCSGRTYCRIFPFKSQAAGGAGGHDRLNAKAREYRGVARG